MGFALTTQRSIFLGCLLIFVYIVLSSLIAHSDTASSSSSGSPAATPSQLSRSASNPHSFDPLSLPSSSLPSSSSSLLLDKVDVYSLFPPSSHPLSSTGEVHFINGERGDAESDYLSYPMCSFTHVCVSEGSLLFRFPNRSEFDRAAAVIADCSNRLRERRWQYDLCQCFYHPELVPALLPFETLQDDDQLTMQARYPDTRVRAGRPLRRDGGGVITPDDGAIPNAQFLSRLPDSPDYYDGLEVGRPMEGARPAVLSGHYWSVHKYIPTRHHIGHWAQRVVLMSAMFQHAPALPLPPVSGIILQDTSSPLTAHEQAMLNLSLYSMLTQQDHPFIASYLASAGPPLPNQIIPLEQLTATTGTAAPTCVERLSFVKMFGVFSTNVHDTMAYRAVAYAQYGIAGLSHRCPPRRLTLLTRSNRRILNQQAIIDWLQQTLRRNVDLVSIDETSTPAEQIGLFASSGLLLASHSSQLVNVMFTHPRAAIVEIAPEYYNSDFSEYAHGMGVFFRYALGGHVPGQRVHDSMQRCLSLLSECEGDSFCILLKRFEPACKQREVCCKYLPGFEADLNKVKMAVQHAINHLNWACGEVW